MRKGRILLTGFLLGSLLLNGCSRNSSLQVVVPKKEQESVLLNQGDESSVQEQVQAPVRYLCDKDFSNFRLLANARVIVPEVEGIQLKKIRSRNFSSEEMERMEKALMKGGAFYEIRQGFDYDTEIKETEIEEEYGYNASSQASLQKKEVGFTMGTGEAAAEVQEVPVGENVETFTEGSTYEELYSGQTEMVKPKPPDSYADAWKLLCDFLDGKKTFYFNTEDDFTTMQELLGETAEKESDWREQLMTQNLVMLCEELSWSTADGTNWERKELKDLAGRSEFLGVAMMDNGFFACTMQHYMDELNPVQFTMYLPYADVFSSQDAEKMNEAQNGVNRIHEENLAEVDLQKQGSELMRTLGLEETELWEVKDEMLFWWSQLDAMVQQTDEEPVRSFSYCRSVDGVPVIRTSTATYCDIQDDGLMNWPQEDINVVYSKNGLVSFNWMAPVEIEDWQDDYAFLLPFSEISQIFEGMLEGSLTIDAGVLTGDLNISEVRLGYVRVISKDLLQEDSNVTTENGVEVYTGVLVPAWSFIGTATGSVAEAYGVEEGTRISYMTINATDGSIIGS